ncbi:1357_t:CDS:2 [Dentiscutata heterogama]|uniref:1357_t:CDS:1 n=1 Tax=Dentiscutata heterogama TaxID=1316150 RepID=A0ACA9K504_9GLOM|nr:1357_t:CDS:2 [Dentiscutata heterogama]
MLELRLVTHDQRYYVRIEACYARLIVVDNVFSTFQIVDLKLKRCCNHDESLIHIQHSAIAYNICCAVAKT